MRARTLCFDIGGSHIKVGVFDAAGRSLADHAKEGTPPRARPRQILTLLRALSERMPSFDRVSAGFPGVVKDGRTLTATNLGTGWAGFDLRAALEREFEVPARIANDADVQGLAAVSGEGIELLLTFGTGLGSALFHQGALIPNLQLGHHPFERERTYEDLLGKRGLLRLGDSHWNRKIRKAAGLLARVFNWNHLYLGGGEAKRIRGQLPENVHVVSNELGLLGGVRLWEQSGANRNRVAAA